MISVRQVKVLPPASFRFHLTMDTLALGYSLPATGRLRDFHPLEYAPAGRTTENRLKYSFQSVFNAVPALHFRDDKVSIAKIRLVPITVSQLKCALHILIGDWYKIMKCDDFAS